MREESELVVLGVRHSNYTIIFAVISSGSEGTTTADRVRRVNLPTSE